MELAAFNTQLRDTTYFQHPRSLCFTGPSYPSLFFSYVLRGLAGTHQLEVQIMRPEEVDHAALISQLSTSFLGQALFYWLGDLSTLDAKKKKLLLAYLATYQGPHHVAWFIDEESAAAKHAVKLPEVVDEKGYIGIVALIKPELATKSKSFAHKIFKAKTSVPLDTACLLSEYQEVMGANEAVFVQHWLPKLAAPEQSLFILSQHFFARTPQAFMKAWLAIKDDYQEPFWIVFWSEQLWRAYYFVKFASANHLLEAKRVGHRLPFSFMQRDWKKHHLRELQAAHQYLYQLDYNFKNGASGDGLEVFFNTFFVGGFKN